MSELNILSNLGLNKLLTLIKNKFDGLTASDVGAIENKANAVTSSHIADNAVTANKISNSAVSTNKIAGNAVTRAKLARDALYSPWVSMSGTTTLGAEHIGRTFRSSGGSIDFILNVGLLGNTIPSAAEFGVFRNWAKTFKIVFAEGTFVALDGENSYLSNPTVSIPNNNRMVALKKIATDSGKDYWLLTGNVEVV